MDTTGAQSTSEQLRVAPGSLVRRLHQAYTAAWVRHVDATLTSPQFAVLTAVQIYPDGDQGSLAACVALDRSTMADVCRRLEDRGLIRRETAPGDGRRKLLSLTTAGAEVVSETAARVKRLGDDLLGDDEDPEGLLRRLEALSAHWEAVSTNETA